jgi:hypothetical protein
MLTSVEGGDNVHYIKIPHQTILWNTYAGPTTHWLRSAEHQFYITNTLFGLPAVCCGPFDTHEDLQHFHVPSIPSFDGTSKISNLILTGVKVLLSL